MTSLAAPYDGRRVVITGGLGFIGSNLAMQLARAGAKVTIVDALIPRHGGNTRNIYQLPVEVVVADVGDATMLAPVIADAEYVFNLAGQVSHIDSIDDPLADFDLNARSQLAFLELLRRVAPEARVIYASTRQVYGRPRYLPVDELHPVAPGDVNGVSKYAAEQLHLLYGTIHNMRMTALRLTNTYGPRQRLRGEHMGFMPVFIARALEGRAITVFGDGSQERDCLYVDDVVDSFLLAAQSEAAVGGVFNIGSNDVFTLAEIAKQVVELAGTGSVEFRPWPREHERIDIGSYHADSTSARDKIGWTANVNLADGLQSTIDFYREHMAWYL